MLKEMHVMQEIRDREHEIRKRSRDDRHERQLASPSIRRAVGRSIIEIGVRLAAEPQPRLARSR
jgi:hypothetical protein